MSSKQMWTSLVVAIVAATSSFGAMQRQASGALPSADREAIELLNARYAAVDTTIRTCGPRPAGDSSRVATSRHLPALQLR